MTLKHKIAGALGVVALVGSAASQAVVIDAFGTTQSSTCADSFAPFCPQTTNDGSSADYLGSSRGITTALASGNGQVQAGVNTVTPGALDLQNSTTALGKITVDWNNVANVDLTEGGTATGIFMSLPSAIDNTLDVMFTINGTSSLSKSFPDGTSGSAFFFPFASFAPGTTFDDVTSIQAMFSGPAGWDAIVNLIDTREDPSVPVPAPIALIGLGLAGLGAARRKQA